MSPYAVTKTQQKRLKKNIQFSNPNTTHQTEADMEETPIEQSTDSHTNQKTFGLTTDELVEIHLTATMFKKIKQRYEIPT